MTGGYILGVSTPPVLEPVQYDVQDGTLDPFYNGGTVNNTYNAPDNLLKLTDQTAYLDINDELRNYQEIIMRFILPTPTMVFPCQTNIVDAWLFYDSTHDYGWKFRINWSGSHWHFQQSVKSESGTVYGSNIDVTLLDGYNILKITKTEAGDWEALLNDVSIETWADTYMPATIDRVKLYGGTSGDTCSFYLDSLQYNPTIS